MKNSSNSSKRVGNSKPPSTKQISPAKRWCFTLNNYSETDCSSIVPILTTFCDKYRIAKEIGESGTPHLQGFISFKTKARPMSVFDFTTSMHWEAAKGNDQAQVDYIGSNLKNKSSKSELWLSHGMPLPPAPIEIDLRWNTWLLDLKEKLLEKPDNRTVNWYWSEDGRFGKTQFTRYMIANHNAQLVAGGKYSDITNLIFHTDMDLCRCVIINLPRDFKNVSYSAIESIKDGLVCNMKSHTNGSKIFNPPHVVVFANFPPEKSKLSNDRWNIFNVDYMREVKKHAYRPSQRVLFVLLLEELLRYLS